MRWSPTNAPLPRYITLKEFCQRVAISEFTAREWIDKGNLQAVQCGRRGNMIHIPVEEIGRLFTPKEPTGWGKRHSEACKNGKVVGDASDEGASNMGGCRVSAAIQPLDQADAARTRIASTAGSSMLGTACRQPHFLQTPQSARYLYLWVSPSSNSPASTPRRELAPRT
jgi:hypothetical protein